MATLTITGSARKTTRCQVWIGGMALITGQLSVRPGEGKNRRMLGQAKCTGRKMIGIMTIQTALITILELTLVWVLVTGPASIWRIDKSLHTGVCVRRMTLDTGQLGVRLGQGE